MTDVPFRVEPSPTPGEAPLGYEPPIDGRVRLTVRLGDRPTGGYRIAVTSVTRSGPRLDVHCESDAPEAGAIVTQVLTSPAQTVSIAEELVRGVQDAVLLDGSGTELAHISHISRISA